MAVKKAETSREEPETKPVVDLLTKILDEFREQVQSKTPKPLEGEAVRAVELFKEISTTLALQLRRPFIDLTNDPVQGGNVTLRWSSTGAQTVSIDQEVEVGGVIVTTPLGELTPAAGGAKLFSGDGKTKFTATAKAFAKGLCDKTDSVEVTFSP